jgi:hypothetical protein
MDNHLGRVLINAQIAAPLFTGLAASACPTNAIDEENFVKAMQKHTQYAG